MIKWELIIISLLIAPMVLSTEVQVSKDNVTWQNITDFAGAINEDNRSAFASLLSAKVIYYGRARNTSHDWGYTIWNTDEGGMSQMEIALAIFAVLFIIIGLYLLLKGKQ